MLCQKISRRIPPSFPATPAAVNAQTGNLLWDVKVADNQDGYGITSAPLALKDKIVVGVSGGDFGIRGLLTHTRRWMGNDFGGFIPSPVPASQGTTHGVEIHGKEAEGRHGSLDHTTLTWT